MCAYVWCIGMCFFVFMCVHSLLRECVSVCLWERVRATVCVCESACLCMSICERTKLMPLCVH